MGISFEQEIHLTDFYPIAYPVVDEKEAFAAMYKNQPVLKALKLIEEGQKYFVKSKVREYFPVVSAFAKYNYKGASDDDLFVGNDFLRHYKLVGNNVNVPIFYGLKRHQQIRKAKNDQKNAALNLHKTKRYLELELEKTLLEYNELLKTLPANAEAVELSGRFFEMSQNLLKTGQISLTDLNDAEIGLTAQKIKYETTRFKLITALSKLQKLTGMNFND